MKKQGHGIEALTIGVESVEGGVVLSNGQRPRSFPCTDFGNGTVDVGAKRITSDEEGKPGLYELFLQSMVTHMKAKGVQVHTMPSCGFCNLLKAEGYGIETLFVAPPDAAAPRVKTETFLSDGSVLTGYPSTDFGRKNVVRGFLPLSGLNVKAVDVSKYPRDRRGLYERFLATLKK